MIFYFLSHNLYIYTFSIYFIFLAICLIPSPRLGGPTVRKIQHAFPNDGYKVHTYYFMQLGRLGIKHRKIDCMHSHSRE